MTSDPTPQSTPPVGITGITIGSGLAPARFTAGPHAWRVARKNTGPHAWRLARKNGELILQGLMRCDEDQYGYGEYWETIPTIDLDEESES